MNKKTSMQQKIENSRFDFIKKSLYFVIIPLIILVVGIILASTVGFSKGIDFAGGQTFKVYVNDEAKLADATVYDLKEKEDYKDVYQKITLVLKNNKVDIVSYQTSNIDLNDYDVYGGQAVKVTYQSNSNSSETSAIRQQLLDAFDYENYESAISSIDEVPPVYSFDWAIGLMAAVVLALVAAIIYMAIRYSKSAIFVVFIQAALDIFLTLALLLICRVSINLTLGIVVLAAFMISLINSFVFYNKVRGTRKSGAEEKTSNYEMANRTCKQILWKKSMFYIGAMLVALLFVVLSTSAVSAVAVGIVLALISTFYTSTFLLPTFWSIVDKPKKAKK